jgi:hypothetical protein
VLMLSTGFAQVRMPRVLDRFGYRLLLTVGLLFLGLPAFLYVIVQAMALILAGRHAAARGRVRDRNRGLRRPDSRTCPTGASWRSTQAARHRHHATRYLLNALGLWLVERFSHEVVFLFGAIAPLLGLSAILASVAPCHPGEKEQKQTLASSPASDMVLSCVSSSCSLPQPWLQG